MSRFSRITFFEKAAAGERAVEHLGQRKLGLQDRELVAITGGTVCGGEGMWQAPEPLPEDRVDLGRVQRVGDALAPGSLGAGVDPIVQRFERDPAVGQLPLEPLVPIQMTLASGRRAKRKSVSQLCDGFHRKEQPQRLIGKGDEPIPRVECHAGFLFCIDEHRG